MISQILSSLFTSFSCLYLSFGLIAQPIPSPSIPSSIEVHLKSDSQNLWMTPSTMLGIIGVLGGITGVLIQRYWQRQDEEQAKKRYLQAYLLDSLKWFEGRTQKRSIGIAVIEGNWKENFPELQLTWVSVITNQIVYLLAQSTEKEDAALEIENLKRLISLLVQMQEKPTNDQQEAIKNALTKNLKGAGLRGIDSKTIHTIDEWSKK